jgi:hypothetical protein
MDGAATLMKSNDTADMLCKLEQRLLQPSVRASAELVSSLITDDFIEFGSSGRVYDKAQILAALGEEQRDGPSVQATASDFEVRILADGVALVTYRTERRTLDADISQSRRSSLWQKRDGRWQMLFHQGTPIPSGS